MRYVRDVAEAPPSFGRYQVTGTLGKGAMGEVYLAVDDVLGREVAVKTLRGGTQGVGARLLDERFRQEARAIAQLAHPGVVQVFDIDVNADPPYLVMERVTGPSLKERLAERPLTDRELRALGIQIANALAAAHAAGIVHRDVKPANILAAGEGAWKLADFGVAHVPDSALTMTGQFVGSPAYAPPEALLRGQLGPAGDIYGLGATLYQAIAGRWPRAEATSGALLGPVPPLRELAPHVAPTVADAIDRAIAVEPDQRPSATELAAALARAATPLPTAAPISGDATEHVASTPAMAVAVASAPGARLVTPAGASAVASTPGTQYVASMPGAAAVSLPPAAPAKRNWQRMAITLATIAVIAAIAITRRSPGPPSTNAPTSPTPAFAPPQPQTDNTIRAETPPLTDRKAEKDWYKVVDKLQEGRFGEARDKLAEFERKHGESPQTRSLAEQLDALPAEVIERGGPPWRHGHDED